MGRSRSAGGQRSICDPGAPCTSATLLDPLDEIVRRLDKEVDFLTSPALRGRSSGAPGEGDSPCSLLLQNLREPLPARAGLWRTMSPYHTHPFSSLHRDRQSRCGLPDHCHPAAPASHLQRPRSRSCSIIATSRAALNYAVAVSTLRPRKVRRGNPLSSMSNRRSLVDRERRFVSHAPPPGVCPLT